MERDIKMSVRDLAPGRHRSYISDHSNGGMGAVSVRPEEALGCQAWLASSLCSWAGVQRRSEPILFRLFGSFKGSGPWLLSLDGSSLLW